MGRKIIVVLMIFWPIHFLRAQTPADPAFNKLAAEAMAARDANKLTDAKALYAKALQLRPNWAEGWWALGTIAYDLNSFGDAVHAFTKAAALAPKSGSARVMLGLCEFELGRDDSALKHIQEGEQIGVADDAQLRNVALYHEGVLLQRAGRFEAAERAFDSLCLGGTDSAELDLAYGLTSLRMTDRAMPSGNPDRQAIAAVGQAACLAGQKKFEAARAAIEEVIRQNPTLRNVHYAYGAILLKAQDSPAAIVEFEREIQHQPADVMARLQIAAAKYKVDSAAGLPYAQAAVKLDPNVPLGHYLLGLLLLDTDQYLPAIPELEKARAAMPQVAGVYSALGVAYARAGRDEDALRARTEFQRLKQQGSTSDSPEP